MRHLAALSILAIALAFAPTALAAPAAAGDTSLRWGGRSFSSPTEFVRWLDGRGLSYETWARNHPDAAARLEGRAESEADSVETPTQPPTAEPSAAGAASALAISGRSLGAVLLMVSFAALAATLLLLAVLPAFHLRRLRVPTSVEEHQAELAGAGIAIGFALTAALLL